MILNWGKQILKSKFHDSFTMTIRPFLPLVAICVVALLLCSCSTSTQSVSHPAPVAQDPIADILGQAATPGQPLAKMGFSTQVGAFSQLDNAVRLERILTQRGVDAYYFRHESGLYKVRFGNHNNYAAARQEAEALRKQGLISRFFIVTPESYAAANIQHSNRGDLRRELVATARRFIGVPYRWGGEDRRHGFDCSGLTMVSYRLNGLNLPRNSRSQFKAGRYVSKKHLQPGDLVFFATKGGQRVTHVGMYAGGGKFIHAPRTGKTVRVASLSSNFFKKTYVGGRTYL